MTDLSDFFNLISNEKKKKEEEFNSIIGELNLNPLLEEVSNIKKENKTKRKKEIKKLEVLENFLLSDTSTNNENETIETFDDNVEISEEEIIKEPKEEPKEELIEKSLGILSEPSEVKQQNDPLTPLDQKFATLDDLQNHYRLFLTRIQQQLSTLGGGGETRLEFLDDVDRNSAKTNNYYLKYDSTINKWVGDPADGVGITSIVSISGVTTYYQANDTDDYIGVSANVPVTIVLPQVPSYGKKLIVKDEGNKISTYNITVQAGIGKSVENDDSVIMKIDHESFTYFYNGNNWYII
jgi:hypothetical protein